MRKDFEMTQQDLDNLLNAMKPVQMIALQCGTPRSVQENANAAWKELGKRLGFVWDSVRPARKGDRFFSAEEAPCRGIEIGPEVFSGCDQSAGDCPTCGR